MLVLVPVLALVLAPALALVLALVLVLLLVSIPVPALVQVLVLVLLMILVLALVRLLLLHPTGSLRKAALGLRLRIFLIDPSPLVLDFLLCPGQAFQKHSNRDSHVLIQTFSYR